MANQRTYRTVTVSIENSEYLRSLAEELTERTQVSHSINDVISVLRRVYEAQSKTGAQEVFPT